MDGDSSLTTAGELQEEVGVNASITELQENVVPHDTLAQVIQEERVVIDSLPAPQDTLPPLHAEDIFGVGSELQPIAEGVTPQLTPSLSIVDNYTFDALLVVIFLYVCYLLYNYRESIYLLFQSIFKNTSLRKIYEEQTYFFKQFMTHTSFLSALCYPLFFIRLGDGLEVERLCTLIPPLLLYNGVIVAALAVFGLVWCYKRVAIGLIGSLTQSFEFLLQHQLMSRLYGAANLLIITPLILAYALASAQEALPVFWVIVGNSALFTTLFLVKSYRFFVEQNVSTLQWILYLCAVEIFPVSFLILIGVRYMHCIGL